MCLKSTEVLHEWWFDQKRNYTRFVRWSYGDALLHDSFPQFTYYNFPNIVEILFLLSPLCIILGFFYNTPIPLVALICGSFSGELIIEFVRLLFLKKKLKSLFFLESVLIRASNDVGRLGRVIKLKKIKLLFQRFDHFCDGKHIRYQKTWSCLKFLCSVILSLLFAYANGR